MAAPANSGHYDASPAHPFRNDAAPADSCPVDAGPIVRVREVTPARWPDFEQLFEARGGPKSCWCMHFRRDASGRTPRAKTNRKRAMAEKIQGGMRVGLLAYDASDEPVAWCSVAPRETLVNHGGLKPPDEDALDGLPVEKEPTVPPFESNYPEVLFPARHRPIPLQEMHIVKPRPGY